MAVEATLHLKTKEFASLIGFDSTLATKILTAFFAGPHLQTLLDELDASGLGIEFLYLHSDDPVLQGAMAVHELSSNELPSSSSYSSGSSSSSSGSSHEGSSDTTVFLTGAMVLVAASALVARRRVGTDDDDDSDYNRDYDDEDFHMPLHILDEDTQDIMNQKQQTILPPDDSVDESQLLWLNPEFDPQAEERGGWFSWLGGGGDNDSHRRSPEPPEPVEENDMEKIDLSGDEESVFFPIDLNV